MPRNRVLRVLLAFALLLLILWVVDLARVLYVLRMHVGQAQALAMGTQSLTARAAAGCSLVRGLRQDVAGVRRDLGWAVALAPALGWLPGIGGDLRAAPHLLALADHLTRSGTSVCTALEPVLVREQDPATQLAGNQVQALLPALLRQIAVEQVSLGQAAVSFQQAQVALQHVAPRTLSPRLVRWFALLQQYWPLLAVGVRGLPALPQVLGVEQPQTFLVQALNEDELRPGGGFLTGVGEVHVAAGRISEIIFRDSYAVDDYKQPYPDPPEPLRRYMNLDLWVLRDSNWSPDFPTSVRQMLPLYRPGYTLTVDGVIAFDQWAVQELVSAIGEITIPDRSQPLTGGTLMAFFREAWAPKDQKISGEWWVQRKSFMGIVATAITDKLEQGDVDWLRVARTALRLLDEKHLLIYLQEPRLAALLAEQGWDGAMQPSPDPTHAMHDQLMLVDANLGYNKANALVQQSIAYTIELPEPGHRATAQATITYTHTAPDQGPCVPEVRYDPQYKLMMQRCYWDYARLYLPRGSVLVNACTDSAVGCAPLPVPADLTLSRRGDAGQVTAEEAQEGPWLVLGGFFVLPTGATQVRRYAWTTPEDVIDWHGEQGTYTLWVRKQPGTRAYPLAVRIKLPADSTLEQAEPRPSAVEGAWLVYQTTLARDLQFGVALRHHIP